MKFMLRTVINIVILYPLIILCAKTIMSDLFIGGTLGVLLQSLITFILLYIINLLLNKAEFLRLSMAKNLWSIKLGILILGLYILGRELLVEHAIEYGVLGGFSLLFAIDCLIMLVLSITLDIILKRLKVEFWYIKSNWVGNGKAAVPL